MISVERLKFKYNKGREGLREINDMITSLCTRTDIHTKMSCAVPHDASELTLYEKVLQMQITTLTELTGLYCVRSCTKRLEDSLRRFPVGGVIIYKRSIKNASQITGLNTGMQKFYRDYTGIPLFICVDEEGGVAQRVGVKCYPDVPRISGMGDLAALPDADERIRDAGNIIGGYLHRYGFNVDLAPVADVVTNGENTYLKKRAFGTDPEMVKKLTYLFSKQLMSCNVLPCYKHFPGIGGTNDNSHFGYATVNRTLKQFEAAEFVPFLEACKKDIPFIMAAHVLVPAISGETRPASLSKHMLTDILRNKMGYRGLIICDALVMDAIRNDFPAGRAAVEAIKAGCDMILKTGNFRGSVNAIIEAVKSGEIPESRIDESVNRILKIKAMLG
ncbi:MAG: glycoside hydrolase family 3 N-terminal domain-containing protein [Eubacteriales bacterium]|nr:glycoside hydrolase family 3 N-terminal domain-containing protein [Eubacteriales bacterium]